MGTTSMRFPNKYSGARFFGAWAIIFAVGVLILLYARGAWAALGALIVMPTIITAALMAWGYIACKIVAACGGDTSEGYVGVVIFLSFAFIVMPLAVGYFSRHR